MGGFQSGDFSYTYMSPQRRLGPRFIPRALDASLRWHDKR